ncbi:MAG: LytTR family transcriptional regulator DNA-binding domain-containing protein [Ignavibacteriae bacterium]|nr:LytTR family transcriptional regulator DNA-binding domain-containing protein [Ignavibacteriota bacterium]MCB9210266.1 LytTR family transcriptional regulator DNA-binding domain-containing protein [Ignavibacteriales bacterium]MCB9219061.1 LytTR family transcriptional regulator DNA-binding domain-containing protein [Ignavibacteriales bacterium]
MDKINVLIIDDEKLARDIVKKYLEKQNDLKLIGECTNGFEGVKSINELKPEIIFLDIQMPKITGFEMLELLDHQPEIIFTTAFDQYAIKAFEVNATDYLLKPFSLERFTEAANKAIEKVRNNKSNDYSTLLSSVNQNLESINRIVVKTNNKIVIIPTEKIKYLEAQDDYVMIHSELGKHLKKQAMKFYEEHLDGNTFFRVHRSFIVNLAEIKQMDLFEKDTYKILMKDGSSIPVSRSGYSKIKELLK